VFARASPGRAGMTVALRRSTVAWKASASVTACSVGTSGMSVATVLGAISTLVNVRASTSWRQLGIGFRDGGIHANN